LQHATDHVIFTFMASLKNVRHEKFVQCVASGLTGADAYRQVMNYTGKEADGNAANWMNRPGVRERLNELKEANSRKSALTREQTIEFLCNVIRTSAASVEADSSLVQSAEFVDGKPVKLRIPDKIAAVKELVRSMWLGEAGPAGVVGHLYAGGVYRINPPGAETARYGGARGS
jgi:hypothetical protein